MPFENGAMVQKLQAWTKGENNLCQAIGQLLLKDEPNVVLNAAGAVASLVETPSRLQWLLQDHGLFSQVLERITCLLNHKRERVVNLASLILARLSLCELACQTLLGHALASTIFERLVHCLIHSRTDTAMNASFTIGCLCRSEQSRCLILAETKEQKLVSGLEMLLSNRAESGAGQMACFALSCLASKDDGHALLMEGPSLPGLLDGLLCLLKSGDPDSTWFAAMTVRVFVSRPNGVTRIRKHSDLEEQLKSLSASSATCSELQEELSTCLRKLKRLSKPSPVTVQYQSMACIVSWERLEPESGLEVAYSLFDGDTVLYRGPWCQITLPRSQFQHKQSLSLRLNLSTSDNDMSPFSERVEVRVERVDHRLGAPHDLRVISCTATEVRLKWKGPEGDNKSRSFQVYCDDVLLETTRGLGTTVSSLSPSTTYTISICALGPGDTSSSRCSVIIHTADGQAHAPSGLAVAVLGCHKLQIIWAAPAVTLGRLFSYELRLNGCVVYLGRDCVHTARHLTANTPYTFTVTAITSRGRYQSRAVTKRTAKDEYMNNNRGLYSPKGQILALPSAREMHEVKNRLPSVMVHSHISGKNTSSRATSEEKSVGVVAGLDANAQLSIQSKERSGVSMVSSEHHNMRHRGCKEHTLRSSSHPLHSRPKVNKVVLLDCQAEKAASEKGTLPLVNQQITENVRLLQPVSYNWSDLDHTGHHHNMHRKRLVMGSRVKSQLKEDFA